MKIRYRIFLDEEAKARSAAFTIVELLIVIVVIAILAAITIISYSGITNRAKETSLKSDLQNTSTKLKLAQIDTGSYPSSLSSDNTAKSGDNQLTYTGGGTTFCLKATSPSLPNKTFSINQEGSLQERDCPDTTLVIQTVTTATCSTTRTVTRDARDNRTYWIQKLADGRCWMLTNLAYAGGGTNTYGDVMPTGNGTGGTLSGPDNSGSGTYTAAKYYTPTGANPTTSPTAPSTSTNGTGQYGYLYNWCAAMKAQTATSACTNAATPLPDTTKSICPAGWRLPIGGSSGEFQTLATAINATDDSAGSTALRTTWLAQYGGVWADGLVDQGGYGYYWSASQDSSGFTYDLNFYSSYVSPSGSDGKYYGQAVRCILY